MENPVAGQYYLAVGLKNTEFKEQFLVTTTSTSSGRYLLTTSRENTPPGNPTFNPIMPGTVPANGVVFYKFTITDRLNDLDGDGIFNSVEDQYDCLDKNVADADKDPDRDGLSNIAELNLELIPVTLIATLTDSLMARKSTESYQGNPHRQTRVMTTQMAMAYRMDLKREQELSMG